MREELLKTVANLGRPKVLLAGDFMLDIYVYGDALRISPEAPVPVLKVTETEYRCGGAGSVAADLAALGALPFCVGITGDDRDGEILREKLTEIGADITGIFDAPGRPTISKQRLIGLAQHRHRQQLIRIDREAARPPSDEQYEAILEAYENKLAHVDIVCLQDHNKGLLTSSLCKQMIRLAAKAGKRVLVDPSLTDDYSRYIGATLMAPNRKEASTAVGFQITNAELAARAAEQLLQDLQLEAVVITLDKVGAYLKTQVEGELVATTPRNVYDVTGAGDMVLATLAAALAAGSDYRAAVQLSNVTGGIVIEKFGAATVTVDEIVDELVCEARGKNAKVRSVDSLIEELASRRQRKQVIVFTNGCFDVLHRGHVEYLSFCKSQGDVVVIGLNSDRSVREIKGPERPINNQDDRAAILAALEVVDYIAIFDEPTPLRLIEKVKPDILVKGEDWAEKGVVGREYVESHGGKVVLAPLVKGRSSTETIERLKSFQTQCS
ncbi:MAG: D-glycero-beta-D-manno-heptose 1-phosphate adenylyltransferase [Phycisphaerales bacterium]|nr:MAG: D-glycero-beta-D-manno-heptose 1-phosphate adenylyltransferase [Phycisphaerales bacterium]